VVGIDQEMPTRDEAPHTRHETHLSLPGDRVGPYTLVEMIGEGGFGTVWLAERREPMVQRVALKIIKPGMDSRAVVARFEQERQTLAVMDHPGVARVFDGGVTERGLPYFVMEYVKGEPLTRFCDAHNATIAERLELFIAVCEAVQHAHHKGIIHRDIKPSNVLAARTDAPGATKGWLPDSVQIKVIDFGIAKAITQQATDHTIFTERGTLLGTPEYMSPEQASVKQKRAIAEREPRILRARSAASWTGS
jgi:serine/threonine protein kinase